MNDVRCTLLLCLVATALAL